MRITSNAPSPRSTPSSVAGIFACEASVMAPSTDARELLNWACTPERLTAGAGELGLGPDLGETDNRHRRRGHLLDRGPLANGVVLVAPGEDVRRGEAPLAQHRTIGPAPDRLPNWLDALGPDRLLGSPDSVRQAFQIPAHVAVL